MKRIISAVLVCILMVGCVFALASCGGPNKDPKEAKKALEEAGYTIVSFAEDEDAGTAYLAATKGEDYITIQYCADEDTAKEAEEEAKELIEKLEEAAGKKAADKVGRSGKIVWMGTKAAIKAAK